MNSSFLEDEKAGTSISYTAFLHHLQQQDSLTPLIRAKGLLSFYTQLILGLVQEENMILIDEDFRLPASVVSKEAITIDLNKKKTGPAFRSMDMLINTILQSKASLTLYTSGTTAVPKQINYPTVRLLRDTRLGPTYAASRWGLAYHPAHMAGLQVFFQAFLNKNLLVNLFGASRAQCFALIKRQQLTHLSATPTFYKMLQPYDCSFEGVQKISIGGERSTPLLHQQLHTLFPNARLYNLFGTTEAGTLFASEDDCFHLPATIAHLIRFEDNEMLLHRTLLADHSFLGPAEDWYQTGDKVAICKEGGFQFVGRKKDTVNVAGYRVNLIEIEAVLERIPGIQQYRVYGRKNSVTGHIICCEISVINPSLEVAQVKKILNERLQAFKVPRIIKIVDQISLTASGKVKK